LAISSNKLFLLLFFFPAICTSFSLDEEESSDDDVTLSDEVEWCSIGLGATVAGSGCDKEISDSL
jgi:hypothetical protein